MLSDINIVLCYVLSQYQTNTYVSDSIEQYYSYLKQNLLKNKVLTSLRPLNAFNISKFVCSINTG